MEGRLSALYSRLWTGLVGSGAGTSCYHRNQCCSGAPAYRYRIIEHKAHASAHRILINPDLATMLKEPFEHLWRGQLEAACQGMTCSRVPWSDNVSGSVAMLTVRSAYHVTHMVKDLEAATALYTHVFQPPIQADGYHEGENRDASFASICDAYIELFAPRDVAAPNPTSNGARYLRRAGESLCNFGWLVDDKIPDAIRFCEGLGYTLVYVAGPTRYAFFIHPKQAHGMMLEIAAETIPEDPRIEPGWAERWRDKHPLGIERMNAVTYAVQDIDGALGLLQELTDAPVIHRALNEAGDEESAFVAVADHVIEVRRSCMDSSEVARFIHTKGPQIHSVTFKVRDLAQAHDYLRGLGLRVIAHEPASAIAIDPEEMLGACYYFTDRAIPSDPRA